MKLIIKVIRDTVIGTIMFMACVLLLNSCRGAPDDKQKVTEYRPKAHEQSSCYVPMCESLGGSDAIALSVMSGE